MRKTDEGDAGPLRSSDTEAWRSRGSDTNGLSDTPQERVCPSFLLLDRPPGCLTVDWPPRFHRTCCCLQGIMDFVSRFWVFLSSSRDLRDLLHLLVFGDFSSSESCELTPSNSGLVSLVARARCRPSRYEQIHLRSDWQLLNGHAIHYR